MRRAKVKTNMTMNSAVVTALKRCRDVTGIPFSTFLRVFLHNIAGNMEGIVRREGRDFSDSIAVCVSVLRSRRDDVLNALEFGLLDPEVCREFYREDDIPTIVSVRLTEEHDKLVKEISRRTGVSQQTLIKVFLLNVLKTVKCAGGGEGSSRSS